MQLLTTAAAAQQLGVVPQTIRRCVHRGELKPWVTTPHMMLFRQADVDKLARTRDRETERLSQVLADARAKKNGKK